jgi:organic radical activating enzyme
MSASPHLDAPYAGRPHRLYFAVTNDCNRACPWCSVYSRPGLQTYLELGHFRQILTEELAVLERAGQVEFEAQFEGGEPTLHPDLLAMVDIVWATGRCRRVVISTNGVRVPRREAAIRRWLRAFGAPLTVKLSVNHHLVERDASHLERASQAARAVVGLRRQGVDVTLVLNLRRRASRDRDVWLRNELAERGLLAITNDFMLQRYGLAADDAALDPPYLAGTDFTLVNPDGSEHGTDLIARSEAMGRLP